MQLQKLLQLQLLLLGPLGTLLGRQLEGKLLLLLGHSLLFSLQALQGGHVLLGRVLSGGGYAALLLLLTEKCAQKAACIGQETTAVAQTKAIPA